MDGASFIGYGHLYRTFVLAKEFVKRGFEVVYITRDFENTVEDLIVEKGFGCVSILPEFNEKRYWEITPAGMNEVLDADCRMTARLAKEHILICDNYSLSSDYYRKIGPEVKLLVAFDDINDREYPVDILINQNYGSENFHYKVKPDTVILAGLRYVLIRDELIEAKEKARGADQGYLLVMFGATDPNNYTDKVLIALEGTKIPTVAVAGRGNPHRKTLAEKWKDHEYVRVHVDPPDVEDLMAGAKAVVTAAGSSVWEFAFLEKPMMVVESAVNQRFIIERFGKAGLAEILILSQTRQNYTSIVQLVDFYNKSRMQNHKTEECTNCLINEKGKIRIIEKIMSTVYE